MINDTNITEISKCSKINDLMNETYMLFYEKTNSSKSRTPKTQKNIQDETETNQMCYISERNPIEEFIVKNEVPPNTESIKSWVRRILKNGKNEGKEKNIMASLTSPDKDGCEISDTCRTGVEIPSILEEKTGENVEKIGDMISFGDIANEADRKKITKLCEEYNDIFLMPGQKLTATTAAKFGIPLKPVSGPIHIKQYRQDAKSEEELRKFVEKLEFHDIIERSFNTYKHPVFLRPKPHIEKDGTRGKRMVVNFVELNKTVIPYKYPLPLIQDLHENMGGWDCYGILDLSQSYHQMEVVEEDRHKLAFTVGSRHYQFKRAPMGICTIAGIFQAMVIDVLDGYSGDFCDAYQDDVLIKGKGKDNLMENIGKVFQRLRENVLKINPIP